MIVIIILKSTCQRAVEGILVVLVSVRGISRLLPRDLREHHVGVVVLRVLFPIGPRAVPQVTDGSRQRRNHLLLGRGGDLGGRDQQHRGSAVQLPRQLRREKALRVSEHDLAGR